MTTEIPEKKAAELLWEKDEVVGRLAKENAGLRERLEALKTLCGTVYPDSYVGSVRGAVSRLVRRIQKLEELLKEKGIELPDWD